MRSLIQTTLDAVERGHRFVTHDIWQIGLPGEQIPQGIIIKQIRVAILLVRGLMEETLLLRASALTFATVLFLVPFLVFLFFIIQTFNLGDQVYRSLSQQLDQKIAQVVELVKGEDAEPPPVEGESSVTPAPAPEPAAPAENTAPLTVDPRYNIVLEQEILQLMFPIFDEEKGLADSQSYQNPVKLIADLAAQGARNPQTIGITGLFFVLSTVFGFMRNVEMSFNRIWGVTRTRGIYRTITDYMMVTIFVPFIAAAVLGMTAALESEYLADVLGPFSIGLRGAQFMLIWLGCAALYFLVPNTHVEYRNALIGGLVAAALWTLTSWAYIRLQFGLANYDLFFSGFALFPLFLMWIYLSWLILLFGSLVSFAYQNEKTFALERFAAIAPYAYREALGVRAMIDMTRRFREGRPGLAVGESAQAWNVPTRLLQEIVDCLVNARFVSVCATDPVTYQPARSPEHTRVLDVVRALREAGRDPSQLRFDSAYGDIYRGLDTADAGCLQGTLAALADRVNGAAVRP